MRVQLWLKAHISTHFDTTHSNKIGILRFINRTYISKFPLVKKLAERQLSDMLNKQYIGEAI